MKLIYILAQGHSGSTLLDCILGTHPSFVSSGELRYLNWQVFRTMDKRSSVADQSVCSCTADFRDCEFWSKVLQCVKNHSGKDIVADPMSFDTAYFKHFSYRDRGGKIPSIYDRGKAYIFRRWLESGHSYRSLLWLEPSVKSWLSNNWLLYDCMARTAGRRVVVDSSKHLLIGLLLQQYRPEDVSFLFIHRSLEGLAASTKRRSAKTGIPFDIQKVVADWTMFEQRVERYKRTIPNLRSIDVRYEEVVSRPASFLDSVADFVGVTHDFERQSDDVFFIDPSQLHLVAGNPMRYRGRQLVRYDDRYMHDLSEEEMSFLRSRNC